MRFKQLAISALLPAGLLVAVAGYTTAQDSWQATDPMKELASMADPNRHPGHTVPSERVEVGLAKSDVVREVLVKRGEKVKKGQTLLLLDDREEQIKLQIFQSAAQSDFDVRAAETKHETAKVELARVKQMVASNVASPQELEKAELEVKLTALEIEAAKVKHTQEVLQTKHQESVIERMRIVSPFDGIVEDILSEGGELIDPQKAMVLVRNDPLWVQVQLPTRISLKLQELERKTGKRQKLQVVYVGTDEAPHDAEVIFYSPEADPSADVQLVRLELPNPQNKPAGLQVEVIAPDLSATQAAAAPKAAAQTAVPNAAATVDVAAGTQ